MKSINNLGTINSSIIITVILILTCICLWPTLHNGSVNYDDNTYVFGNSLVNEISSTNFFKLLTESSGGNYIPLTNLSLALNYTFSGTDPFSYHLINLILHLINTLLVFLFINSLTNNTISIASVTALFFGIHPMHVESVAWIVERKDLLFTCFYILGMILHIRYRKQPSTFYYLLVFAVGILSLLSKPAAVTLPIALLLIDFFYDGRFHRNVILRQIPLLIASCCIGFITISIQSDDAIGDLNQYTLIEKISFASYGIAFYFVKAFIPFHFSVMHPYPINGDGWIIKSILAFCFNIVLFGYIIWKKRTNNYFMFGASFFILNLLLVLQFFSVGRAIVAERYSYLPYIGLFFIVGYLWDQFLISKANYSILSKVYLIGFALYCLWATWNRSNIWKSSETLWSDVIQKYPDDWYAYIGRGNHYRDNELSELAINDYNKAIKIKPDQFKNYFNRGDLYRKINKLDLAIADYSYAISLQPNYAEAYVNRGQYLTEKGNLDAALADLNYAIQLDPTQAIAFCNRGNIFLAANKVNEALSDYNRAIALDSNFYEAWYNRGNLWLNNKQYDKAISDFLKAIAIDNSQLNAYNNLGNAYYQKGDLKSALIAFSDLVNRFPNYADGWMNRSITHYQLGKKTEAQQDALKAQKLGKEVSDNYLKILTSS